MGSGSVFTFLQVGSRVVLFVEAAFVVVGAGHSKEERLVPVSLGNKRKNFS